MIPLPMTTWLAGGVAALAIAAAGVQTVRLASEKAAHAESQAGFANERVEALEENSRAQAEQREEYERREEDKTNVIQQAKTQTAAAGAAGNRADAAGVSLQNTRDALAASAREACKGAGTGPGGAPAGEAIGVLADVQRRADERAGILAKYADAARIAGQACERSYDSLTVPATRLQTPAPGAPGLAPDE